MFNQDGAFAARPGSDNTEETAPDVVPLSVSALAHSDAGREDWLTCCSLEISL